MSTTPDQVIEQERHETAEDFLAALRPSHPRWGPDPRCWVYRGQSDASWKLFAKAHRDGGKAFEPFGLWWTPDQVRNDNVGYLCAQAEIELLKRFVGAFDRAGLPAPLPLPEIDYDSEPFKIEDGWRIDASPIVALAQHFGLPTSLLDWTSLSRNAAYFGAAGAAERADAAVDLAVWAVRIDFVGGCLCEIDGAAVSVEHAPSSSNPNLAAQQGLFTRMRGEGGPRLPLDKFVQRAVGMPGAVYPVPWPIMRCVRLPQSQAPKLLRLLSYDGVTGSTMFPGYDGVVRAMREQAMWDDAQRGLYDIRQ